MRFDPFTDDAIDDPYAQYHALREADPVHWSDKLKSWVLFRHDDVGDFFRDDVRLSSDRAKATKFRPGERRSDPAAPKLRTVAIDPPEHGPVRALLNATLAPRVRAVAPRVDELVAVLLARVADAVARIAERADLAGEVDFVESFAYPLPIDVICELFDVPERDRGQIRAWSHAVARGMDRFYSRDEAGRGLQELHGYFFRLVEARRGSGGDDLIRRLAAAEHRGDRFSELEVVAMCGTLVFAGHETTVNLLGNGLLALLRHPEQLERLRAEPELIDAAVEELLRYDSPAQLISRTALVDFELRGKTIRAGDAVLAGIGAANRDPAAFADADRLDVGRTPNPHLAFGFGTHFCPGAQLTRIEARAALPALLRRFPRLALAPAPPVRRRTAVLRGLEHLPVRFA
jgi:cytochrome P450